MKLLDKLKKNKTREHESTVSKPTKNEKAKIFNRLIVEKKENSNKANLEAVSDDVKNQIKGSFVRSVGVKLFFTIILGVLICVIMMGQFAYNKSEQIIEEQAIVSGENTIEQLGINIDNKLKTYQDLSLTILIDQAFHVDLDLSIHSPDDIERLEAMRRLTTKLQNYLFSNEDITGVALIPMNEQLSTLTAGSSQITKINEIRQEEWFQQTIDLNGQLNWIDARATSFSHSGNTPSFGLARLLKNTLTNQADYVLFLDITTKGILDQINRVGATEGGELSIISSNHHYIAHMNREMTAQPINFDFQNLDSIASKKVNINGEDMLLIQTQLDTNGWYLFETKPVDVLVKEANVIREMTFIVALIAAGIAVLIAGFVIYNISLPLVKIRNLMVQGADGNLTIRAKATRRKDEIGQLATSFNLMMGKITDLANQTKNSAEAVLTTAEVLTESSHRTATSAKEIAIATEEIANGATSLAGEAERGNDITVTINEQMKSVLSANEEMKQSAFQVEQASEQGTSYMHELIAQTGKTEEMTRNMVEKVETLQESTQSIRQILDMLNAVTKQTNILSLNATIEAARAGAAGRGFMVVANEIRNLADQSTQSIDVVGNITEKIQQEINETVNVLTTAYPLFQEQVKSVHNANEIFVSVQSQMSSFIEKLEQVTNSVNHLEQTQNILNETMSNVSAVAEESSATSEEVASLSNEQLSVSDHLVVLSQQLNEMSKSLKDAISKFKVE